MRVLAIESSAMVASVAVIEDEKVLGVYTINNKRTHSQTIMPMIEAMKKQLDFKLSSLDAIGVSGGPGSYTGLRIGSSIAKGLAHVLDIPIVGISTIESMANNITKKDVLICPMLDARREHVFSGVYTWKDDELINVIVIDQWSVVELCKEIIKKNKEVIFLGDGFTQHEELIIKNMGNINIMKAKASRFLQEAVNIGFLAIEKMKKGEVESYMNHEPDYYRLSQAEREYQEKH